MDNGISIKDTEVRNLVLLCDTKEEFIQMLGRKRQDGQRVKLYLWKRDPAHFKRRLQQMMGIDNFFRDNMDNLLSFNFPVIDPLNGRIYTFYEDPYKQFKSQKILESIFSMGIKYARSLFYPLYGYLYVNNIAVKRCKDLCVFYNGMVSLMEEDKNAFINMQLGWLNKSIEEIQDITDNLNTEQEKIFKETIIKCFDNALEDKSETCLDTKQYRQFKNNMREPIKHFYSRLNIEDEEKDTILDSIEKTDRTFSADNFNAVLKSSGIPYRIEEGKGERNRKIFYIKKV